MNKISKPILTFFSVFSLMGCTLSPQPTQSVEASNTAQQLYIQSIDELVAGDDSAALDLLRKSFPQSIWTQRAATLAELLASRRELGRQNHSLTNSLSTCEQKGVQAARQIEQQRGDLQRLKELVIEMEIRSR